MAINDRIPQSPIAQQKISTPIPLRPSPEYRSQAGTRWVTFAIIVLGIICSPTLLTTPLGQRGLLAASLGGVLFMLLLKSPRDGVFLTLIYLSILGGLRRWLIPVIGWVPQDPLILVQAAIIGVYFSFILVNRRLNWDTRLARSVGWLLIIMTVEIINPLQGGIMVGVGGILFMMVPPLWYYAGRRIGTPRVTLSVVYAALTLSFAGAIYGMYQIWFGYLPSELVWIKINGVADKRVFSFFTLMAEYGVFLEIGVTILWAAFLKGNRAALVPMLFLIGAIFFLAERSIVVGVLFSCAILWAVQSRNRRVWLPRILLAIAFAGVGLFWSLQQAQHINFGAQTQELVEHQTSGLLDPGHSTATAHTSMIYNGVLEGLKAPWGHGLGSTTIAASRLGTGSITTESDWGDSFVSLGLAGGLLYTFIIGLVFVTSIRQWMNTRSFVSLAVLGILLSGIRCWLNGDFYATSMLMWFLIGAQDQAMRLSQIASVDRGTST